MSGTAYDPEAEPKRHTHSKILGLLRSGSDEPAKLEYRRIQRSVNTPLLEVKHGSWMPVISLLAAGAKDCFPKYGVIVIACNQLTIVELVDLVLEDDTVHIPTEEFCFTEAF